MRGGRGCAASLSDGKEGELARFKRSKASNSGSKACAGASTSRAAKGPGLWDPQGGNHSFSRRGKWVPIFLSVGCSRPASRVTPVGPDSRSEREREREVRRSPRLRALRASDPRRHFVFDCLPTRSQTGRESSVPGRSFSACPLFGNPVSRSVPPGDLSEGRDTRGSRLLPPSRKTRTFGPRTRPGPAPRPRPDASPLGASAPRKRSPPPRTSHPGDRVGRNAEEPLGSHRVCGPRFGCLRLPECVRWDPSRLLHHHLGPLGPCIQATASFLGYHFWIQLARGSTVPGNLPHCVGSLSPLAPHRPREGLSFPLGANERRESALRMTRLTWLQWPP
ncbi:uncharacterized protein LOC114815612 [Ornithorhynchus anatinus]|uniref:uncharacterized protein LOC114815612 n=1 Tax=Ornithorhynchus anatinus TaxID=9258 RepID=UPI0010A80972|nr:uncharacterized protein LOC114815612 [Ornithorhynchus anatinus]